MPSLATQMASYLELRSAPELAKQLLVEINDIFDKVLELEEQAYEEGYAEGYNEGWADGLVRGRTDGRFLGLKTGFQKFFEAGELYGKSLVWSRRLPVASGSREESTEDEIQKTPGYFSDILENLKNHIEADAQQPTSTSAAVPKEEEEEVIPLPVLSIPLQPLPRPELVAKDIKAIRELLDPETLPTHNPDANLDEADARIRKARARALVIERQLEERPKRSIASSTFATKRDKTDGTDVSSINIAKLANVLE